MHQGIKFMVCEFIGGSRSGVANKAQLSYFPEVGGQGSISGIAVLIKDDV